MLCRNLIGSIALVTALAAATFGARAHDETRYPDWKGQWIRIGGNQWDPTKPIGLAQDPPLTPEYQAIFEASMADQATGGPGNDKSYICIPPGMPRTMVVIFPMEIVVLPETTYIMSSYFSELRRIFTDGRAWPENIEPSFVGYSIGKWIDEDGDGRNDTLAVETRGMKGPRTLEPSGLPLHQDNQTVVKERLSLDHANQDILHDEITVIDNALTRPWTIKRSYRRERNPIAWVEFVCAEDNHHVAVGNESYFVSGDGYLMPTRKGQPAPNLKYFGQSGK
jgi:hypothetical protein